MSRTRSMGSSTSRSTKIPTKTWYVRKLWQGGHDVFEYRTDNIDVSTGTFIHNDTQTIIDTVGSRGFFNECHHTKYRVVPVTVSGAYNKPSTPPGFPAAYNSWVKIGESKGPLVVQTTPASQLTSYLNTPSLPRIDWASLVYQVGSQLDGRMTTGQNLLVSLAQLSQVVGMVKNPFNLKKLPRLLRSKPLGELSRMSASSLLEYQFGWKPLMNDIRQLAVVTTEVSKHTDYLRETVNKYVSLASRQVDVFDPPIALGTPIGGDASVRITPYVSEVKRSACFSVDVRRTEAALAWTRMDQVLNRLGTRDVALALWDLVPFSFVVDWFTHINRFLEQGPIGWEKFDLRRVGYSTKVEWFAKYKVYSVATSSVSGVSPVYVDYHTDPLLVKTSYDRWSGFPDQTTSVGLFGNLNKTQIAEGLALIVQRL